MRTLPEITANISKIHSAMQVLSTQINLLDTEYQQAAIDNIGEPYEVWSEMRDKLQTAWHTLNQLWHMEADTELDLYAEENERKRAEWESANQLEYDCE